MSPSSPNQKNTSPYRQKKTKQTFSALLILAILWYSGHNVGFSFSELQKGAPNMWDLVKEMFPPDWAYFTRITEPILETIRMAVLGTTFGALLAMPLALLAARNVLRTPLINVPARWLLNLIRTIPDLLLAAIFVAIFGIGAFSGVLALIGFSMGIIGKLIYESIEGIDEGPLEAMRAVGANQVKLVMFGVIPQVTAQFLSFSLYSFEVNVRAAAVLGLVGAGGIGLYYDQALGFFDYARVSTIILYTLIVVLIIDFISTSLREKLS
ncbi:phosphonate ABC transporter, permease protein PhnE [Alkalicoccobacillus plakortidis]|uniref:Phosphonate ABC transporter, permease protein PhnE n=1 Tax=Alkalicoccobacillus plakortidis TaxID=444060 RepID=A0ABT0XEU5_9BACI|nr:phosphonate ABC transporter, permease protein PhnE [Alkalicoccobacillus plakortidis]MCM2674422.1 phosphonate ABC transporter, permease protein PhnE [Alkalicoccobacillus plakortidis]